jgi:hypothetical protein
VRSPSEDCIRYGRDSGAYWASCRPVLRKMPDSNPSMKAQADPELPSSQTLAHAAPSAPQDNSRLHANSDPGHPATDIPTPPNTPTQGIRAAYYPQLQYLRNIPFSSKKKFTSRVLSDRA